VSETAQVELKSGTVSPWWEGSRRPGTSSADGNSFSWGGSSNNGGSSLQMTFLGVRLDIAPEPGAPEPEMLAAE